MSTSIIPAALKLKNDSDAAKINYKELPRQRGSYAPPPQPGRYVFGFGSVQELVKEALDTASGKTVPVYYSEMLVDNKKRWYVQFREGNALLNYGPADQPLLAVPTPVETMINNNEREVGKAKTLTSAMANLLAAVGEVPVPDEEGKVGNLSELVALVQAYQKKAKFIAVTRLSAQCNSKNDIYVWDAEQNKSVEKKGQKGCGLRWGIEAWTNAKTGKQQLMIPEETQLVGTGKMVEDPDHPGQQVEEKEERGTGRFAIRFNCQCGAYLRAGVDIDQFYPYEG